MAFLGQTYDAGEYQQASVYEPIPAGWYEAVIASADLRDTRSGTGQYIRVRFDITGPTHAGRVVFANLNIRNANPRAEEIGRQQLGALICALGLSRVSDTDQLVGGSLSIRLTESTRDDGTPDNEVRGYKALGNGQGNRQAAQTQRPAWQSSTTPPSTGLPPWVKR